MFKTNILTNRVFLNGEQKENGKTDGNGNNNRNGGGNSNGGGNGLKYVFLGPRRCQEIVTYIARQGNLDLISGIFKDTFDTLFKIIASSRLGHGPLTKGRITQRFLSEGVMETFLSKMFILASSEG
jgi:hypothetical protein